MNDPRLLVIRIIKILETIGLLGALALTAFFMMGFGFSTSSWGMLLVIVGAIGVLINVHLQTKRFYETGWAVKLIRIFDVLLIVLYGGLFVLSIVSHNFTTFYMFMLPSLVVFHSWSYGTMSTLIRDYGSSGAGLKNDSSFKHLVYWTVFLFFVGGAAFVKYQFYINHQTQTLFKQFVADPIPSSVKIHSASYFGWLDASAEITFTVASKDFKNMTHDYPPGEPCSLKSSEMCWEKEKTDQNKTTLTYAPATRIANLKYFSW